MAQLVALSSRPWTDLRDLEDAIYPANDGWDVYSLRMLPILHDRLSVLAIEEDAALGYCVIARLEDQPEAWVLGLGVVPGARRRGLGASLLDQGLRRCQQEQLTRVWLTVEPGNAPAIGLYRSRGFAEVGSDPAFYGPGSARLIMALPLLDERAG